MAEHKFTDEELQKCIECCIKAETWGDCETMACPASTRHGCRFYLRTDDDYENTIYIEILKDVLDLINRQKAEVEKEIGEEIHRIIGECHNETWVCLLIKEFADRLTKKDESQN